MLLQYKLLNESIEKRQKLVTLISEKNAKNEKFTRKDLAKEMKVSVPWIDKARKQINTEDLCIVYSHNVLTTRYQDIRKKGVYSKIIKMIEYTETIFPFCLFSNKQLCEFFEITDKTAWMYRAFISENIDIIIYVWDKNKSYLDEIMKDYKNKMKINPS